MNTPLPPKTVMTTHEVAEYLGVSDWEVRRLHEEGYLKKMRGFRKPMKFSSHNIIEYLKNGD